MDTELGAEDDLTVRVDEKGRTRRTVSQYFVNTTSGSAAYIATGRNIPYRQRWVDLHRRYAQPVETVVFQQIESGMEVTPRVAGEKVHLRITPIISELQPSGGRGVVHFTSASTEITVPFNQWVDIGGAGAARNEVMDAIMSSGQGQRTKDTVMEVMVERY